MLFKAKELIGSRVHASDTTVGSVKDVYFDDERWGVRYLVVDTGGLFRSNQVLLSPASLRREAVATGTLQFHLTREQIENSPPVESDQPVSRHYEVAHALHYGYPNYWTGPMLWGAEMSPGLPMAVRLPDDSPEALDREDAALREEIAAEQSHLRSAVETLRYDVAAIDGPAGTLDDLLIDTTSWALVHLVVDSRKWWPGGQVLISPTSVENFDWANQQVHLRISRDAVKGSPTP
jgi:sporulation protein YlmC with PRC-barrel domain